MDQIVIPSVAWNLLLGGTGVHACQKDDSSRRESRASARQIVAACSCALALAGKPAPPFRALPWLLTSQIAIRKSFYQSDRGPFKLFRFLFTFFLTSCVPSST